MVGLPRSYIKKYGVSKKAWAMFRASKSSGSTARTPPMARRRRFKSFARKSYRIGKRYAKRAVDTRTTLGSLVLPFLYGTFRPTLSNAVAPLTSKIPAGQYADEAGMAILGYAASRWGSGAIKSAGKTMLQIEAYRMGEQVGAPLVSGITGGMTSSGRRSVASIDIGN